MMVSIYESFVSLFKQWCVPRYIIKGVQFQIALHSPVGFIIAFPTLLRNYKVHEWQIPHLESEPHRSLQEEP